MTILPACLRAIMRRASSVASEIGALEIGPDHSIPIRLGLLDRKFLDRDAGVVDQHGDRTERRLGRIQRGSDRRQIGDVHLHRDRASAAAP